MRGLRERIISGVAVVVIIALITIVYLVLRVPASGSALALSTPGPARTTYTNPQYGYSITYPTDWTLSAAADGKTVQVFLTSRPGMPEDEALDILAFPNPQQLGSDAWWQQHHLTDGSETAIGQRTLKSNVAAYVSQRQAQSLLMIYTIATPAATFQLISFQTRTNYDPIVAEIVNSFTLR